MQLVSGRERPFSRRAAAGFVVLLVVAGLAVSLGAGAGMGVEAGQVAGLPVGRDDTRCADSPSKSILLDPTKTTYEPTALGNPGLASRAAFFGEQENTIVVPHPTDSDVLYVSDVDWVRKVTLSQDRIETIAGTVHTPGSGAGDTADNVADAKTAFLRVYGMTIDAATGVLYLVEHGPSGTTRVRTLTPVGTTWRLQTIATDPGRADYHAGIAVTPSGGAIYIAQPHTQIGTAVGPGRLAQVQSGGLVSVPSSQLISPQEVVSDGAGQLYVAGRGAAYEVTGNGFVPLGGDYTASSGDKRLAVNQQGTRLIVSDLTNGTISQINLDEDRGARKLLASGIYADSLWYRSKTSVLIGTNCKIMEAGPFEVAPTTVAPTTVAPTTVVPTTVTPTQTPQKPTAIVTDVQPAPVAKTPGVETASLFGRAPAESSLAPPPVAGGETLGTGSGSGSVAGSGAVLTPPPPPPVVQPLPTPSPLLSPGLSPTPNGVIAGDPTPAVLGAPRHAMVRSDPATSPGPALFAVGAVVVAGCVAVCAVALGRDHGRAQRAPVRAAPARARA